MILSYNTTKPKNLDDSSSSIEEEEYIKIEDIINRNASKKPLPQESTPFPTSPIQKGISFEDKISSASGLSKIDFGNQSSTNSYKESISISKDGLSHGEDCIQKDVLKIIEEDSLKKNLPSNFHSQNISSSTAKSGEAKVVDVSEQSSSSTQKNKNFILKSAYLHNSTSSNNGNDSSSVNNKMNINLNIKMPNITNIIRNSASSNSSLSQKEEEKDSNEKNNCNNNKGYMIYNQKMVKQNKKENSISLMTTQVSVPTKNEPPSVMSQISPEQLDVINNCLRYAKEQFGCRLLQKIIDEYPDLVIKIFYNKIKPNFIELSCDIFGNYFIQKIIEHLSIKELDEIVQVIIPQSFRLLCLNPHGTRVIQKIVISIKSIEKLMNYFVLLLTPFLSEFVYDPNASHIISRYFESSSFPNNNFIIEFLNPIIVDVITQKQSCCVLQNCIEASNQFQRSILLHSIANNSYNILNNQFAHYVIQYVISLCDLEINHILVLNLLSDFLNFSSMKYSSSIIEKCMQFSDKSTIVLILEKMCSEYNLVERMLFDMYGNYVLQRALSIATEPYRSVLLELIAPKMESLKIISFGKKLYNKLISSYPELNMYIKKYKVTPMQKKKRNTLCSIESQGVNTNNSNINFMNGYPYTGNSKRMINVNNYYNNNIYFSSNNNNHFL